MEYSLPWNPSFEAVIQNEMYLTNEPFDVEDTPRARDTFYCVGCHRTFDIQYRARKERTPRCLTCDKIRKERQK